MPTSLYTLFQTAFPDDHRRIAIEAPDREGMGKAVRASWSYGELESFVARYASLMSELTLRRACGAALFFCQ